MKKYTLRVTATLMALAMVVGMLVIIPMSASAAETTSSTATYKDGVVDTWDGTTISEALSGTGTEEDPYLIKSAADFAYFYRKNMSTDTADEGYYKMTVNVELSNSNNLDVLAGSSTANASIKGVLDGDGYTLINPKRTAYSGARAVFGAVSGTIKNLNIDKAYISTGLNQTNSVISSLSGGTLMNMNITNLYIGAGNVGVVNWCGSGDNLIENVYVQGTFDYSAANNSLKAGIIATVSGPAESVTMRNVTSDLTITLNKGRTSAGNGFIGAMIGAINNDTYSTANTVKAVLIENCTANGTIYGDTMGSGSSIGGFVGCVDSSLNSGSYVTSFEIRNCTNNMDISVVAPDLKSIGGFVGTHNSKSKTVYTNCVNNGDITLTNTAAEAPAVYAGGFVGYMYRGEAGDATFLNCAQYGDVSVTYGAVGGLIGHYKMDYNTDKFSDFDMQSTVVSCTINGSTYMGALIAWGSAGNTTSSRKVRFVVSSSSIDVKMTSTAETGPVMAMFMAGMDKTNTNDTITVDGNSYIYECCESFCVGQTKDSYASYTPGIWTDAALSDGTIVEKLNAYVTTYNTSLAEDATKLIPWAQSKTTPIYITTLGISGATMSLSSNMALNMKLAASTLVGLTVTNVAFVDAEGNGINAVKDDLGRYSASYVKRAADMAEEMELHLVITVAGNEYVSTNILTYSPLTYLTNLYADYTGEKQSEANATKVLNVVTAMLSYGAAAETKDSGATTIAAKMSELKITAPTFTEGYTDHISGVVTEDDKTAINNIAQVGATLTGGMELTFTMKNTAYTALSIADFGVFYADENGKITVTGINAAMILDTLSLTFTGDGVDGVSANFTVGDFLESRRDNADETALAEATILYMMAARAYVLN